MAVVTGGRSDWRTLKRFERVHAIERCLHGNLVVHSVYGIQPLVWRGLPASRERDEHAVGDVALLETDLLRFASIDIDLESRVIDFLVDVNVYGSWNCRNFTQQV